MGRLSGEKAPLLVERENDLASWKMPHTLAAPSTRENQMRLLLTALISLSLSTAALADMQASFEWGPTKKCFDSKSPPFKLSGVPAGTTKLDIKMVDMDAMSYNHGGGKVDFKGQQSLPYGAFRYSGPCPPMRHSYRFTVKALDASGKTLATAKASKDFPQ